MNYLLLLNLGYVAAFTGLRGAPSIESSSVPNKGRFPELRRLDSCSVSDNFQQVGSDIDGEAINDESGKSISLSSDGLTVAIGAWKNGGNGEKSGHVRVYENDGTTWSQKGSDIDGEAEGDESGISVSLSSNGLIVAIGANKNDGNGNNHSGHVRVFEYDGTDWSQKGSNINGEAEGDYFGAGVSLSSDGLTLAVGASYHDVEGFDNAGHVRVFQYARGDWSQMGLDIDGEKASEASGLSVSLSADGLTVAIGAYGKGAGTVRVYGYDGTNWSKKGSDIDGEAEGDMSGMSVSLSAKGLIVAIGAKFNDGNGTNSGHVRVYEYDGTIWSQKGSDIDGDKGSYSGSSVSLSSDGLTVAIGANNYSNRKGYARLYDYDGSDWLQKGSDIYGEADGDKSGNTVSLSSDGVTVAIGAYKNDGSGMEDSGHVRVMMYCPAQTSIPSLTPSMSSPVPSSVPSSGSSSKPTELSSCTGFNFGGGIVSMFNHVLDVMLKLLNAMLEF